MLMPASFTRSCSSSNFLATPPPPWRAHCAGPRPGICNPGRTGLIESLTGSTFAPRRACSCRGQRQVGDATDLDVECLFVNLDDRRAWQAPARPSGGRSSIKLWRQHHGAAGGLLPAIALPNLPALFRPRSPRKGP